MLGVLTCWRGVEFDVRATTFGAFWRTVGFDIVSVNLEEFTGVVVKSDFYPLNRMFE